MKRSATGSRPAGGPNSRVVVNKPVITGKPGRAINPAAVAQLGGVYGSHITERRETEYRGEKWLEGKRPVEQEMGNTIAAATKCGVGGSREVFKSGSQGQSSPVRSPNAQGRSFDEKPRSR